MTREELVKSDEYITAFLECVIVSGKSVKKMRKEVLENWLSYRDEFGRIKWKEAQQSALKANSKKLDKDNRHPVASFTPYKP